MFGRSGNKQFGYLAESYLLDDFAHGIERVLILSNSDYKTVAENDKIPF